MQFSLIILQCRAKTFLRVSPKFRSKGPNHEGAGGECFLGSLPFPAWVCGHLKLCTTPHQHSPGTAALSSCCRSPRGNGDYNSMERSSSEGVFTKATTLQSTITQLSQVTQSSAPSLIKNGKNVHTYSRATHKRQSWY